MGHGNININLGSFQWFVIFFLVLIILFVGEPDLHDAIITWAMK